MLLCLLHRNCRREHPHYLLHTQVHGSNQGSHRLGSSPALSGLPSKKILVEHVFFLVGQADAPETLPPIRPLSYDASTCSSGSIIVSGRIICPMIPVRCAI